VTKIDEFRNLFYGLSYDNINELKVFLLVDIHSVFVTLTIRLTSAKCLKLRNCYAVISYICE